MFTGIITAVGTVLSVAEAADVTRFVIAADYDPATIDIGASIACGGPCLTVTDKRPEGAGVAFSVDVGPETRRLTTARDWHVGTRLNIERSLRIGDELGGHLVSGHVDGIARIVARETFPETVRFTFEAPPPLHRYIAVKGSVSLDGTSLTVNTVEGTRFSCHLIPHTLAVTTWGERQAGDAVNLEVDMMARYFARLAETA